MKVQHLPWMAPAAPKQHEEEEAFGEELELDAQLLPLLDQTVQVVSQTNTMFGRFETHRD